jgi:hypothetical protein
MPLKYNLPGEKKKGWRFLFKGINSFGTWGDALQFIFGILCSVVIFLIGPAFLAYRLVKFGHPVFCFLVAAIWIFSALIIAVDLKRWELTKRSFIVFLVWVVALFSLYQFTKFKF